MDAVTHSQTLNGDWSLLWMHLLEWGPWRELHTKFKFLNWHELLGLSGTGPPVKYTQAEPACAHTYAVGVKFWHCIDSIGSIISYIRDISVNSLDRKDHSHKHISSNKKDHWHQSGYRCEHISLGGWIININSESGGNNDPSPNMVYIEGPMHALGKSP